MNESRDETGSSKLHLVGDDEALRSLASAMVLSMPPMRRGVFVLAIAQRLCYREIAERLGITEDSVKLHMRDGLATIHQDVMAQPAVLGKPRRLRSVG